MPVQMHPNRLIATLATALLLVSAACAPVSPDLAARTVPAQQAAAGVSPPSAASLGVAQPAAHQQPAGRPQQAVDQLPGRILYVRDGNLWIWQTGQSRQFSEGGTWYQPAFSPDGSQIAYVYWDKHFSDVIVMTSDGSTSRRLTRNQAGSIMDNSWAFRPSWSPDGERLAFVSDATSRFPQIWVMAQDGGGRRQVSLASAAFYEESWVDSLDWEPHGERLVVTGAPNMEDPSQIYLVDLAEGTAEKLTSHANGAFDPSWSPDGESLAYIGRSGQVGELWVRSLDGEKTAHLGKLQFVRSPVWSPDGKSIALLAHQNGVFEIFVVSVTATPEGFELGEPRPLTRDAAIDPVSGLTWAP